jgi:uncharacterized protein YhaN
VAPRLAELGITKEDRDAVLNHTPRERSITTHTTGSLKSVVRSKQVPAKNTARYRRLTGMSTGARDQFYLALRLAYLEEYSSRAEAALFIGDDLFASFDEDRTANGLAALAAMGDRVQPIVFTHQARGRYCSDDNRG